ncbi:MAG: tetratricopeptide repeat protein [Acidobacteriota bacterium]
MAMHVLLLLMALAAQRAPAPSADQVGQAYFLYIQGRALDDSDDLPAAAAKYKQALELLPQSAELRAELAGIYAQQGAFEDAQAEAQRALALQADNRTAHRVLGLVQASEAQKPAPEVVRRGLLNGAAGHLERVLADGSRDPLAQLTLADLYVQVQNYAKAIDALKQFLLDRPGYPQAVMLLVQAYRGAGQTADATAVLEEFRRSTDTSSPTARLRDIEQFERQGAWAQAADAWVTLLTGDPDNVAYRLRYATALVNAGDVDGGRSVLTDLTRDRPDDTGSWYLLAQVEERVGNLDAAETAARRIATIDSTDVRGPLALADVRQTRGDFRGVVDALDARILKATDAEIRSGAFAEMAGTLGNAWMELGEGKRATQVLEAARKRAPADRAVAFSLASMYERTRQFDRAERGFREILAADPQHAPTLNYLGYLLADRGRKLDEAVSLIQKALALDDDNPSYLDSLGWAYYKQDKLDAATVPLERAAAALPDSSVVQEHLGDLYLKRKRYIEAAAAFGRALAGDRDGLDADAVTKKRDRARALSGAR